MVLPPADLEVVPDKQVDDIDAEIALFKQALEGVRADMRALSSKLASQLRKEERALFDVYLMMLDDASIGNEVKRIIRTGQWAQGALRQVVMEHVQRFELMDDAYLRERASDVKDIGRRLLAYLQEERKQNLTYPEQTIIVSESCRRRCSARCRKGAWSAWSRCSARATRTWRSSPVPWASPR